MASLKMAGAEGTMGNRDVVLAILAIVAGAAGVYAGIKHSEAQDAQNDLVNSEAYSAELRRDIAALEVQHMDLLEGRARFAIDYGLALVASCVVSPNAYRQRGPGEPSPVPKMLQNWEESLTDLQLRLIEQDDVDAILADAADQIRVLRDSCTGLEGFPRIELADAS